MRRLWIQTTKRRSLGIFRFRIRRHQYLYPNAFCRHSIPIRKTLRIKGMEIRNPSTIYYKGEWKRLLNFSLCRLRDGIWC